MIRVYIVFVFLVLNFSNSYAERLCALHVNPGDYLSVWSSISNAERLKIIHGNYYGEFPVMPKEILIGVYNKMKVNNVIAYREDFFKKNDHDLLDVEPELLVTQVNVFSNIGDGIELLKYTLWLDANGRVLRIIDKTLKRYKASENTIIHREIYCEFDKSGDLLGYRVWQATLDEEKKQAHFIENKFSANDDLISTEKGDLHYESFSGTAGER